MALQSPMDWRIHIESNPTIMLGKPVFKGTRLTVQQVLERLADGATESELLHSHPRLRPEHFRAAHAYAAAVLAGDDVLEAATSLK